MVIEYKKAQVKKHLQQQVGGHAMQNYNVIKHCDSLLHNLRWSRRVSHLCVFNDSGKVVFIFPICKEKNEKLHVLGSKECFDYVDAFYLTDDAKEIGKAWQELLHYLSEHYPGKTLNWKFLGDESLSWYYLKKNGVIDSAKANSTIYSVRIFKAQSHEEYFDHLGKKAKQNVRTAYNRLNRDGHDYNMKAFQKGDGSLDSAEGKKVFSKCLDVYIKRQTEKYGKNPLYSSVSYRHFNYVTKSIQEENGIILALFIDGEIAAFMGGYVNANSESIEIPWLAMDEKFAFYSPGMILVNEVMKYLHETDALNTLDLCRGTEKYKLDMGGKCTAPTVWSSLLERSSR